MAFSPSSRGRLTDRDRGRFPADTLFDRLGRAVCAAGCLPRKELFESWEMARRIRRIIRGGRIVDLGGGHGLLAQVLLLLDRSSEEALVVDRLLPPSSATLHAALVEAWPDLAGRIQFVAGEFASVPLTASDLVVSSHACGRLTDRVLELATAAGASVAVLPCCHDLRACDDGALGGWLDGALAIDVMRAIRVERCGYRVRTMTIRREITPRNRLLIGIREADAHPLPAPREP
jgi:hypothetical protein